MTATNYLRVLAVLTTMAAVLVAAASLLAAKPAHAVSTFTVNLSGDGADANLTDNVCDVRGSLPGSQCTLRAAIQQANATANSGGPDLIKFAIPGAGVKTISPASALPPITEAVTIDGYTQPGSSSNTVKKGTDAVLTIELSGANAGSANGLFVDADNCVVRGLVINRFSANGIAISNDGSKIEGNFLGTDATGTQDLGNGVDGVQVGSSDNNTVGGTTPEARNLISGNNQQGIQFFGTMTGNRIEGNLIGTQKDGTGVLGNSQSGVLILNGGADNTIGGTIAGAANTIAFNGGNGVRIVGNNSTGNRILRNSIFSNGALGIDLTPLGPTANDPLDPDTGPNGLQNKPGLTSATTAGSTTTVQGKLNSAPNTTFTVQFFSNPPGTDEGKKFVGDKTVTTDGSGKANFTKAINPAVRAGQTTTATATDPSGNTSEFSAPRTVVAG